MTVFLASCGHTGSNVGQQDDVIKVSLQAQITKPFLDHDMIPTMLQGKEIYCYYSDIDYKQAVNANAQVIDDDSSVAVTIIPEKTWWSGNVKYRITETKYYAKAKVIIPCSCDTAQKGGGAIGKLIPTHKEKGGIKQVKPVKTTCWNTPCYVPENGGGRVINISINGNGANVIIGDRNNAPSPTFDPYAFPIFNNLCDTTLPRVDLK